MATQTTNLGLDKPAEEDNVDVSVLNGNMDKIDQYFPFKLGIDSNGNYGYYKVGADTITPFNSSDKVRSLLLLWYDGINNVGLTESHSSNTTKWIDLSGHNRNGTITNGTWMNNGLSFNGSTSWVNCGQFNPATGTFEVVVKFNNINNIQAILCNAEAGGFEIHANGRKAEASFHAGGSYRILTGSSITTNTMYVFSASYNGTDMTFYLNGTYQARYSLRSCISAPTNNTVLSVGSNPTGSSLGNSPLNGTIYSVRIWDATFPQSTIAQLSNEILQRFS